MRLRPESNSITDICIYKHRTPPESWIGTKLLCNRGVVMKTTKSRGYAFGISKF